MDCENLDSCEPEQLNEYEVGSLQTIYSGFARPEVDCDFNHECDHYRQYCHTQKGFIFQSNTMQFARTRDYWQSGHLCDLCKKEIMDPDEEVLNWNDMCTFHECCLRYYLHCHNPPVCPGCDETRCTACWRCSY